MNQVNEFICDQVSNTAKIASQLIRKIAKELDGIMPVDTFMQCTRESLTYQCKIL